MKSNELIVDKLVKAAFWAFFIYGVSFMFIQFLSIAHAGTFKPEPSEYIVMPADEGVSLKSSKIEASKKWLQGRIGARAFGSIRDLDVGFQAYSTGVLTIREAKQFALEFPELHIEPDYVATTMEYLPQGKGDRVEVPIDELFPPNGNDDDDDGDKQPDQKIDWGVEYMRGEKAWEKTKGKNINVAVIDTGVDVDHPDLPGLLDCYSAVPDEETCDDIQAGHGTHVAGIIGARDNNIGYVGMAPEVGIGAFKGLSKTGSGKYSWLAEALKKAADSDVKYHIANHSWGGSQPSELIDRVGKAAKEAGMIQVCAAGNTRNSVTWPARYPWCIAVASSFLRGGELAKSGFSSWGKQIVTIAPGSAIFSTIPGGKYGPKSGTSMASPGFVGSLALALAAGVEDFVFEDIGLRTGYQGWGHPRADWTVK